MSVGGCNLFDILFFKACESLDEFEHFIMNIIDLTIEWSLSLVPFQLVLEAFYDFFRLVHYPIQILEAYCEAMKILDHHIQPFIFGDERLMQRVNHGRLFE